MTVLGLGATGSDSPFPGRLTRDAPAARVAPGRWTLAAGAYALCLIVWIGSGWGVESEIGQAVLNLAFQPLNAAAAWTFWQASRRAGPSPRLRTALSLLAVSYASVFVGNTVWFVQASLLRVDPTFSWPNIPYLLCYLLGLAGVLTFPAARRARFEWWKFALDALLTSLGGVAVVWFLVIRPLAAVDATPLHRAILLAFPISALTFLVALLALVLRRPAAVSSTTLRLFAAGQGLTLTADLVYQLLYENFSYSSVHWVYVLYATSYVLLVWAADAWTRGAPPAADTRAAPTEEIHFWSPLPWIAAGAVYALLLWSAIRTWTPSLSVLAVVAILLTILLLAREAATVRQNVRLLHARALRESELRFESLVRHSTDPLLILDADLVVRFASPATARVLGLPDDAVVGTAALGLLHPEDATPAAAFLGEIARQPGAARAIRWRVRHESGVWRHLETVATNLLGDPSVRGIVLTGRDVTERDSLEEQLRQAQKMEAIGQLAGGIAHDFNNLLTTILGTSELALEQLSSGHPLRQEIEEIQKAGRRAAALTGQLLAFSRKQVIEAKVLDVGDVVAGTHRLLQRLVGEHINFVVRAGHDVGCVRGDAAQLEQTLVNLIVNARDAIDASGMIVLEALNVELPADPADPELAGLAPGPYVALRVTDTGAGMDAATSARIFEPFFTTKGLGRGTGLGLATVYGIVQRHGGAIVVRSTLGEGSCFTVYLPRVERAPAPAREPQAVGPGGRETILVVEDEAAVLRTASRALRLRGYTVLEAGDGDGAVRLVRAHAGAIDLVIMDVILPGRSGPQIVAELRRLRPSIRVLYASGYTGRELAPHGVLAPDVALLQKPYSIADLAEQVRQALASGPAAANQPRGP